MYAPMQTRTTAPPPPVQANATRPKVLLVEDNARLAASIREYLEKHQVEVHVEGDGLAAAGRIERLRPDLVILDLMMERADGGFALSYRLKKRYPDVPVVMVTGVQHETGLDFTTDTAAERAWIKADAVLGKPVRFEQLKRELSRLLPRE